MLGLPKGKVFLLAWYSGRVGKGINIGEKANRN